MPSRVRERTSCLPSGPVVVGVLVAPTNPDRLALFDLSSSW